MVVVGVVVEAGEVVVVILVTAVQFAMVVAAVVAVVVGALASSRFWCSAWSVGMDPEIAALTCFSCACRKRRNVVEQAPDQFIEIIAGLVQAQPALPLSSSQLRPCR